MMPFNVFPSAYLSFNFMLITIEKHTEQLPYVKLPWSSTGRANLLTLWKAGKNFKKIEAEKELNYNYESSKTANKEVLRKQADPDQNLITGF